MGRPMIMGRKTFQSIGKPLPGRETIVLTRDRSFSVDGVLVAHDLEQALDLAKQAALRLGADAGTLVKRHTLPDNENGRFPKQDITIPAKRVAIVYSHLINVIWK